MAVRTSSVFGKSQTLGGPSCPGFRRHTASLGFALQGEASARDLGGGQGVAAVPALVARDVCGFGNGRPGLHSVALPHAH